jgi:hypothetical protein
VPLKLFWKSLMNVTLRITILFALLGPLLGGIVLAFIYSPEDSAHFLFLPGKGGALAVLIVLVIFYPKALLIGFVPACLTGVTYAHLWQKVTVKKSPWPSRLALSGVLGGVFAGVFHGFALPLFTQDYSFSRWHWLGMSGAIAAMICAAIAPAVVKSKD